MGLQRHERSKCRSAHYPEAQENTARDSLICAHLCNLWSKPLVTEGTETQSEVTEQLILSLKAAQSLLQEVTEVAEAGKPQILCGLCDLL